MQRRLVLPLLLSALAAISAACGAENEEPPAGTARLVCAGCTGDVVDFGAVAVGEAAELTISLANRGDAVATLVEQEREALPAAFEHSLLCQGACDPRVIEPGDAIRVTVRFRPDAMGASEGVLDLAPLGPTLRLRGTGVGGEIRCDASLDFGKRVVGSTRTETVTCTNEGGVPRRLRAGPFAGDHKASFALGGTGDVLVEAGASASFDVTFVASGEGERVAFLRFLVEGELVATTSLRGEVVPEALVFPSLTDGCTDLGFFPLGSSRTLEIPVENASDDPVSIHSAAVGDTNFEIVSFPATVAPGATETLELSFTPAAAGTVETTLEIAASDRTRASRALCLRAHGGGPELHCESERLEFGTSAVGFPREVRLRCSHGGVDVPGTTDDMLRLAAIEVAAPFTAHVVGGISDEGYAPGERFEVAVGYAPEAAGTDASLLRIGSNDVRGTEVEVALEAEAEAVAGCALEVASTLDFGQVWRERLGLPLALRNGGTGTCFVGDLRLPEGSPFSAAPRIGTQRIEAGATYGMMVEFDAASVRGAAAADLDFFVSEAGASRRSVALRGNAGKACLVARPGALDFGVVRPGCRVQEREIRLLNNCATDVQLTAIEVEGAFAFADPQGLPTSIAAGTVARVAVVPSPDRGDERDLAGLVRVAVDAMAEQVVVPLVAVGATDGRETERHVVGHGPIDMLLVIDNSTGSDTPFWLHAETFLAEAGTRPFQIGVTTTGLLPSGSSCPGGVNGGEDGRLFPVIGTTPRIITPVLPLAQQLEALETNASVGICHGSELGLEAMRRALSAPVIDSHDDPRHPEPNDGNLGFLREEAELAVFIHSDEEDQSPLGVGAYVDFLQGLKDDPARVRIHTVSGGTDGCRGTGAYGQASPRYVAASDGTGGIAHSICDQAPTPEFNTAIAGGMVGPRRCYALGDLPEDTNADGSLAGEIEVRVNGTAVPTGASSWSYQPGRNEICFEAAALPDRGSELELSYRSACL
ncbi:choice-of-anchor D domain-containing protein [Vulgatibacter sp.]|uniref:choice-of-anchor D domain-containing protein n=1 Tax=Vulgatibacter sp. TaxID=1971226 RepID=UPI0035659EEF